MEIKFSQRFSDAEIKVLYENLDLLIAGKLMLAGRRSDDLFSKGGPVGSQARWAAIWSILAETLHPVAFAVKKHWGIVDNKVLEEAVCEFAGSEERLIWSELDGPMKNHQDRAFRGKQILKTVVETVSDVHRRKDVIFVEGARLATDAAPLNELTVMHSKKLVDQLRWEVCGRLSVLFGVEGGSGEARRRFGEYDGQVAKDVWLRGVLRKEIPTSATPALAHISRRLGEELMPTSEHSSEFEDADPYRVLYEGSSALPSKLADKFLERKSELLDHKRSVLQEFGYKETGISDNGTTELDRFALKEIFRKKKKGSILIFAPTSSGKTRFAQFAVLEAVNRKKEGASDAFGCTIVLAPTKALVNQIARDYRQLLGGTECQDWVVVEGTRDHPQYNDHLRLGKFDIAVVIPEKLSAMMRLGMSLRGCPLIVVDEFQHLVDGPRGLDLEMLMVDAFERYPDLRWVALSASLGRGTRRIVGDWLTANKMNVQVHDARCRPVPLTVRAVSRREEIEKLAGKSEPPIDNPRTPTPFSLNNLTPDKRKAVSWNPRGLDVLFAELAKYSDNISNTPSILFFVHSRLAAVTLASATRALMVEHFRLEEISKRADPFTQGRFEPLAELGFTSDRLQGLREDFRMMSPSRLKGQVRESVRDGVGFHTATLNSDAREIIEESFRTGHIRVLFATDTLKLGVNLPSDMVINGDMFKSGGSRYILLDKDTVIQRLGRAGRLGFKTEGIGELVVPDEFPPLQPNVEGNLDILPHDLEGLGGEHRRESAVFQAVTNARSVMEHYLMDWDGGAEYSPPSGYTWILDATLRLAAAEKREYLLADLVRRATGLYSRSLAGVVGQSIDPTVVDALVQDEAMTTTDSGRVKITRLGWSLASNSVSIENATVIKDIAEAARQGAGPFTLLHIACSAPLISSTFTQMQCKPDARFNFIEGIYDLAGEFMRFRRVDAPMLFRHFNVSVDDAVGEGLHADKFRASVNNTTLSGGADATALWRAATLMMWWSGKPMYKIDCAVEAAPGLVDEVAVHQLAEAVGYLLNTAADLEGISPVDMTFRTLQHFSSEIEIGLPTVFGTFLRVKHRSMNRHRLIGLIPYLDRNDIVWDNLDELLVFYVRETGGYPPGSNSKLGSWAPLSDVELEQISSSLKEIEENRKELARVVPPNWANRRVPHDNAEATIGEIVRKIESRVSGADEIFELLEALGFIEDTDLIYHRDPYVRLSVHFGSNESGSHTTYIEVSEPGETITHAYIDEVISTLGEAENCVIIDTGGCSHGVVYRSDFHSDKCVVIHPNLFVEMIARVYESNRVKDRVNKSEHFNEEAAKSLMGQMLINSAPVLNRADLENRMARLHVAI